MASVSIATFVATTANYNITTGTPDDWALWNAGSGSGTTLAPSQRKSGGGSTISSISRISTGNIAGFSGYLATASWSGGTPTASGSNANACYNDTNGGGGTATGLGASFTVPADTTTRTARVYCGTYNGDVTLTATLSDGSAGPATNTSLSDNNSGVGVFGYFDITYSANSASQTLTLAFAVAGGRQFSDIEIQGVTVKAAASGVSLVPGADSIVLTGQTPTLAQTANQSVSPAQKAITITGPAPTLAQTANQAVSPAPDTIVLTGLAPTLQQTNGATVSPPADTIVIAGQIPTIAQTANQSVSPAPDTVVITGFAPSIVQASTSVSLTPGQAQIIVAGYAPTLFQSGAVVGTGGDAGYDRHRAQQLKKKRRQEAKEAEAWLREQDLITEGLKPRKRKERVYSALDLPMPSFDAPPRPKAEPPKPSPKVAAVAKAVQARRQAERAEAGVDGRERAAQEQKAEQERKDQERQALRARNRRKAMQFAAQFFFN